MSDITVSNPSASQVVVTNQPTQNVVVSYESVPPTSISVKGIFSGSGDSHFVHTQSTPESVWEVTHSLNKKPSVTVVDSADTVVIGEVEYLSSNAVRLTFVGAFSGKAYFN